MSEETIGLLLTISSGILSIVSFITIFISMNSQHNVQRSREILWNIATLPYKKDLFNENGAVGKEVFRKFILYEQIINDKNTFLRKIITFAQMSLTFTAFNWTLIILNLLIRNNSSSDKDILFFSLCVTISFLLYFVLKILGGIKNVCKVGQLPTVEELLDINSLNTNLNMITLAAISSRLKIINNDIYLGFPVPFKNVMVNFSLRNNYKNKADLSIINGNLTLEDRIKHFKKLDSQDFKLLDDDYCYYEIYSLQTINEQPNNFFALVEFISKQGLVSVEYYCDNLRNSNESKLIVYPYSFSESFINRKSELDPFSNYIRRNPIDTSNSETEWFNIGKSFMTLFDKE